MVGMETKTQFGSDIRKRLEINLMYLVREKEDRKMPPEPWMMVEMVKLWVSIRNLGKASISTLNLFLLHTCAERYIVSLSLKSPTKSPAVLMEILHNFNLNSLSVSILLICNKILCICALPNFLNITGIPPFPVHPTVTCTTLPMQVLTTPPMRTPGTPWLGTMCKGQWYILEWKDADDKEESDF